jgi:hypothetical protein
MINRPKNRLIGLTIRALRLWTKRRKKEKDSKDKQPAVVGNI